MNMKNSEEKCTNYYEDEYENMKNKNCNFDFDFDIDIDEADECFTNSIVNSSNGDCCEEEYQEGFKNGYEKAKQEVLAYIKKNKCFRKCKHSCKPRHTNKNKKFHNMIKCR